MNGGVVKFDSLPDPDRAGAEDHDHGFAGTRERAGFALIVKGRVEVRRFRVKFRRAGIHHFEDGGFGRTGKRGFCRLRALSVCRVSVLYQTQ